MQIVWGRYEGICFRVTGVQILLGRPEWVPGFCYIENIYIYIYSYIYIYIHTYTHTHIHIHMHTGVWFILDFGQVGGV